MFTGIIHHQGTIKTITKRGGGLSATIIRLGGMRLTPGDSISINGICSTVVKQGKQFEVEWMPETVSKTTVGEWKAGSRVNLELPLRASDRLGGHIVQGHVDCVGKVSKIVSGGSSRVIFISIPAKFRKFVAEKGSVTIDGVSLTVSRVARNLFSVSLVDYTLKHTTLGQLKIGDKVNIETDIMAKYVHSLLGRTG